MRSKTFSIVGFGLVAVLALTFAVNSEADFRDKPQNNQRGDVTKVQIAATKFSGVLKGQIRVDGRKYIVTDDTMVYFVGEGLKTQRGLVVDGRPMVVRGKLVDGVLVAQMIIVRPEARSIDRPPAGSHTPSESNPRVGVYEGRSD